MSVYSLTVGLVVKRGDRTLEFDRRLEDDTIVLTDQVDRSPMRISIDKLSREISAGTIKVLRGDRASSKDEEALRTQIQDLATVDEKYVIELSTRLAYINALRRRGLQRGMRAAIKAALPQVAASLGHERHPMASTVMQWWRDLDRSGGNTHAVINGNAKRQQPRRLLPLVEAMLKQTIKAEYCNRQRKSLVHVQSMALRQLQSMAQKGEIPEQEASVSATTVARRVRDDIDGFTLDTVRYGPAYARHKWRYSLGGVGASRPLERFEIDHTVLDIVVVCDRTGLPLGRPTITVIVDSFSGYVCGFFISFWGTGIAPSLSALKQAILRKDQYRDPGFGLESQWLGYGIPELIVCDNGLEFHSPKFLRVALALNTDVRFCAVRQPWLKPVVERTMRTINASLPAFGRVERRIDNYLPIDPDKSAALTFTALCQGLLKAFVDVHPFEVNERKLARPFDLFSDGFQRVPPPNLPIDDSYLDIIVAPSRTLTVGNEGIVTEYLRFNSTELQETRRRVRDPFRAMVKIPHENLECLHVQDPKTKGWIQVPSCNPEYTTGLSLVQHKAIRTFKKEGLKGRDAIGELMRRKAELAAFWASQVSKRRHRAKPAIQKCEGLTSSQVIRNIAGGDVAIHRPADTVIADVDLKQGAREIPIFDTITLN
jgi:putative transposase